MLIHGHISVLTCIDQDRTVNAKGILEGEDVLKVLKGSTAKGDPFSVVNDRLLKAGVVKRDGPLFVFVQDHSFPKPSPAAQFVLRRKVNGWEAWKTQDGTSLKQLAQAASGTGSRKK